MSAVELTTLSSKGQLVIPASIRADLKISGGAKFAVVSDGENILLRRVEQPKLETFKRLIQRSRSYARQAGLKKSDVQKAIRKVRSAGRS
jgi:AbrB family looped-hinge helix DNA binding protein